MNVRRLRALVVKESLQVVRDPSSILIAVVVPLILIFLMGYAVSLDAGKIRIAFVSHSDSDAARTLLQSFMYSKEFEVEVGKHMEAYLDELQDGKVRAIVHLRENFGHDRRYPIQIIADDTEPNTAGLVQKYAGGVIGLWSKTMTRQPDTGITVASRYWFNAPVSSRYFLLPGSIAVVMTLIGTLLTALVIAREWERGTMEALMATPASMLEIIIGKLVPYFVLGMGSMLLCFSVAYFWYDIPFRGSFPILLLLSATYLYPSLSIGLLISTLAKNQFVAAQAAIIAGFLPAFILSGFLFEISNMPSWLQVITHLIPARYFVASLQTIFLAGNIPEIFIANMIGMIAIGSFFFILILKKTRKGL